MPQKKRRSGSRSRTPSEPAPGSSSGGSNRTERFRFRYPSWEKSRNCFAELKDNTMTVAQFKARLEAVEGVTKVELTRRGDKASQGNPDVFPGSEIRGHIQDQRFEVFSERVPCAIDFELTRSKHMLKPPLTRSAAFLDCPRVPNARAEGFRILWNAVHDQCLFPNVVMEWWEEVADLDAASLNVVPEETEEQRLGNEEENKEEQEPDPGQPLAAATASSSEAIPPPLPRPPPRHTSLEVVMAQAKAASETTEGPHAAVTTQDLRVPEEAHAMHVRMPASTGPAPGSP